MHGLYAIVDTQSLAQRGLQPLPFAEAVLSASPAAVQLRDKVGGASRTLALLRELNMLAEQSGVPLYANDRPDLAALAGCAGVHLGQRDVPPSVARTVFARAGRPDARVGMSVHNARELEIALSEQPDYVALGPVYGTASKERPDPSLGLDGLDALLSVLDERGPRPTVAIGGIDLARAGAVAARCDAAAVIAALLPERDATDPYGEVAERARALHAALGATRGPEGSR